MKLKSLALMAAAMAALTATQASATAFYINYSGIDVVTALPFTANLVGDQTGGFATTISGTRNGIAVTGLSPYASATQAITGSFPYTNLGGLSYSVGTTSYNFFTYYDGKNYETNSDINPGGDDSNIAGTFSQIVPTSVTASVPEPATWAMMLAGFAMVGFGLRSRRKQTVRVTYA